VNAAPVTFRLQTLGQPALFSSANPATESDRLLGPGKPLALLAFCCSVREREHPRDYLTTLLWSDSDATRARQNLRQTMWRIRRIIGEAFQATEDAVVGISDAVSVDRDAFVAAVHSNDAVAALAIYKGAFLLGMSIPGGDEFEDWAANERRHLEESLVRVVTAHAKDLIANGRTASARDVLEQLLKRTPGNVDAHRVALELTLQLSDVANSLLLADALELIARSQERETPAIQALITRARKPTEAIAHPADVLTLDLVGREEVFGAVMNAWTRARGGVTTAVSLTGAPGIGKTRLLTALAQRCRSKGAISVVVKANQGERDRLSADRTQQILTSVSLWSRQGKVRARWLVGPLAAVCLVLAAIALKVTQKPQLIVSQAPMTTFPVTSLASKTLRTMPSVAIAVDQVLAGESGRMVHVRAMSAGTRIVAGDSAHVVGGVALFNTLRFESDEKVVRLLFETPGFSSATLAVTNPIIAGNRGLDESARLRLAGGRLNTTDLSQTLPQIRVSQGAVIEGFVQAEYSTHWPTAAVWLSMTPTWGEPKSVGVDLTPIMTPVRREVTDVPISLRAPLKPGHYWIIFVIDAEDSGGYALSRTNWMVGHPIWGDGNEVALLPDSSIRRANVNGFVNTSVTYLKDWDVRSTECAPHNVGRELPLKNCSRPIALFGVAVIVE